MTVVDLVPVTARTYVLAHHSSPDGFGRVTATLHWWGWRSDLGRRGPVESVPFHARPESVAALLLAAGCTVMTTVPQPQRG